MAKKADVRIVDAKRMYLEGMKLVEIASQLKLPEGTVRRWKSTHKWDSERSDKKDANVRIKKGGQPGNKNATGPPKNQNARKHGLFSKWLPEEIKEIIGEIPAGPIDILWHNIQLQYANIIRSQHILYVEDKNDTTKELSMSGKVEVYDIQYAWNKQANNLSAQSRAMKTLLSMIKEYEDMLHKNWDSISEEQQLRMRLLRAQRSKLEGTDKENEEETALDKLSKIIAGVDKAARK